jgi:hypothetical protein
MRENINKVSQRGERLDSLQDKTDNLAVSAQGFRRGANRVRKSVKSIPLKSLQLASGTSPLFPLHRFSISSQETS